jgi:diguanylate cyclase (GGDEF)-like protein
VTRDPLTGLRANPPFKSAVPHRAAIWIDVDQFKALNDRAGHAAGDQAIVEIARAIRGVAGDDCTWRAGGDEFLVTLPGSWGGDAPALAARIRSAVEATGTGLTVSVGVAVAEEASGSDARSLIKRAEDCQRGAKGLGRNAVSDRSP